MHFGEIGERGDLLSGFAEHRGLVGELWLEHGRDDLALLTYQGPGVKGGLLLPPPQGTHPELTFSALWPEMSREPRR